MKKIIFSFILGGIIFGCVGICAENLYKASDIVFTKNDGTQTNVNDSLNDLYNQLNDKINVIYLGTGQSFDLTSYEGYENFTTNNFIVEPVNMTCSAGAQYWNSTNWSNANYLGTSGNANYQIVKNYSNGVLSTYSYLSNSLGMSGVPYNRSEGGSASSTGDVKAYLVIGNIEE